MVPGQAEFPCQQTCTSGAAELHGMEVRLSVVSSWLIVIALVFSLSFSLSFFSFFSSFFFFSFFFFFFFAIWLEAIAARLEWPRGCFVFFRKNLKSAIAKLTEEKTTLSNEVQAWMQPMYNNKLVVTSASLLVTSAILVVTRS